MSERSASPKRRGRPAKTAPYAPSPKAPKAKSPARSKTETKKKEEAVPAEPAPQAAAPAAHHAKKDEKYHYEFGGPIGAFSIMVFSHVLLYYVYYVLRHNGGHLFLPSTRAELEAAWATLSVNASPTLAAAAMYFAFIGVEAIFAFIVPGLDLKGRPDETGRVLTYRCNAALSWWITLAGLAYLHFSGLFSLTRVYDNAGHIMTVAILFADALSLILYVSAFYFKDTHRMSGYHIYDFFMGATLHPRIGILDIKMFAEIRISWFLLFVLTVSSAAKMHEQLGYVTPSMWFLVLAHFLYANACAKGEHYVPPTWDITYEKFGWMLCFWNFAGVPFLYSKQSVFLVAHGSPAYPSWVIPVLTVVLLIAYYIWDTSQSQKNHFRLQFSGVKVERWTFPQLPWRALEKPKYLTTARGTPLLVDGWWAYARKIHYTCDIVMALSWGLACGFSAFIPYLYVAFFTSMIIHRYIRDVTRCKRHYGKDWDRYCETVPYAFIPGLV